MNKRFFISGIGTEVGKTIASAILTEKMQADYWKPIQAGDLDNTDSMKTANLITNSKTVIFPEAYRLKTPMSPHAAANIDGVEITSNAIKAPFTTNNLIIEGAGGLLVPLNESGLLLIDLIPHLKTETILVSRHYLGSINHTLLSIEALKRRNLPIFGIIFIGNKNETTEQVIANQGVNILGRIPELPLLNKETIKNAGKYINL